MNFLVKIIKISLKYIKSLCFTIVNFFVLEFKGSCKPVSELLSFIPLFRRKNAILTIAKEPNYLNVDGLILLR